MQMRTVHLVRHTRPLGFLRPFIGLLLLALPVSSTAQDFGFKVEPGVAFPLTPPQSTYFDFGGSESMKALFGIGPWFDLGPTATLTIVPSSHLRGANGTAWAFGGGVRLKRPHDMDTVAGISPWIDADALYVRTGPLHRPGFDAGVGLAVPIGERRTFWLGPFARFAQVIQPEKQGSDNRDARFLSVGLSLEVGSGVDRPVELPPMTVPAPVTVYCPDMDGDQLQDSADHCPEVAGPIDNWGCPVYKKITVQKDKLVLKEKLFFAWDEATLEPASFPVLDEVVVALKDNKGFKVLIEGHTDSTGNYDYNQDLSEKRAEAVLEYLATHGIARDRLSYKGFSSSEPTDSNNTVVGRENNRRVEFVVNFILVNTTSPK
jgi:outer membrane protein OmpA-like peptidoglycan-associated protein